MFVACCQFDIAWEDKPANFAKVERMLAEASLPAGTLVLLPEMFATGFSMNVGAIAERPGGETEQFMARVACRLGIYLLGGVVTFGPGELGRNEAIIIGPDGSERCRYRKLHPFSHGGEDRCYAAGEHVAVCDVGEFLVAPFICYDLRFPEAFRMAARRGAQLLAVIANWPAKRESHWITLLKARAIENQAYVAAVNRCGNDPNVEYQGRSLIVDPRGEVLADAGGGENVIQAQISVEEVSAYRQRFPALRDMRSDLNSPDG